MKINVLGTKWTIKLKSKHPHLESNNWAGFTDITVKEIHIREFNGDKDTLSDLERYERETIRHELVHAFLYESGLDASSDWARNEEIIDWIAIQALKLNEAFKQAGADY